MEACNATNGRDLIKRNGYILQLTRWRGPGQTWRVRGNIFVAQIRSETPPDMFFILPLLCSATDTPIFCTSGNNHIPSHTDTVRVCWKQSIFSKKKKKKRVSAGGSVQCNKRSRSDQAKRIYFLYFFFSSNFSPKKARAPFVFVVSPQLPPFFFCRGVSVPASQRRMVQLHFFFFRCVCTRGTFIFQVFFFFLPTPFFFPKDDQTREGVRFISVPL